MFRRLGLRVYVLGFRVCILKKIGFSIDGLEFVFQKKKGFRIDGLGFRVEF